MDERLLKVHPGISFINAPFKKGKEYFVVNNTITGNYFDNILLQDDVLLEILNYSFKSIKENDLIAKIKNYFPLQSEEIKSIIEQLINNNILLDCNLNKKYVSGMDKWISKGWKHSLLYHLHSNNIKKDNYLKDPKGEEDRLEMIEKVKESKVPDIYKTYNNSPKIKLHKPSLREYHLSIRGIFEDKVGLDKKRKSISFLDFSHLVYFSIGQTSIKRDLVTGNHISKTSPSGGARHPNENYIFVHDVENIKPGLYHYDVKTHSLSLLCQGDYKDFVQNNIIIHKGRPSFTFKVCFIHTLIFERSMHRYRESRSFRAVNHDLGHVMQTIALLASSLDRNSYRGYSLKNSEVENMLGIDGITESAITYSLVG